jgi:uncharacterized membrane protein
VRAWIGPIIVGLLVAVAACYVSVSAIPRGIMHIAINRIAAAGAGVNRMAQMPLATDTARVVVRPSPDLAYSSCPFDLSERPLLVEVPVIPAPYWSLSVFDGRTNTAFVRNNFQAQGGAMRVALIAEGQAAPAGIEAVRVPTRRGIALVRILVPDRAAFAPIDQARQGATCRSL